VSAGEVAAVVAAVTGVASVGLLVTWLVSTTRALTTLTHQVEELRRQPVRVAPGAYPGERLEATLVDPATAAAAPGARPAPRLATVAFSDPVIKAVAFASGTRRAARAMRKDGPGRASGSRANGSHTTAPRRPGR